MKSCVQCQMRYPNDTKFCFVDGGELVPIPDPRIGQTIAARYVVEEQIGEGGMASVYRARNKLVDRPCAIKIMNPMLARDPVVRERFRREAKSAQKLAHPNIIEIFDQGDTDDGTAYIAMELLSGSSLAELVHDGPVDLPRAIGIMIQIARGIARAHDLEVIHRDLKPENIFICKRDDGSDLVKLLDFGIARSRSDTRLTNAGELFGTPQYMAPERITNPEAGASVDLYALGVIFFEMATGALPFDANDVATYLVKHIKEPPKNPRSVNPQIPVELEGLILRLLAKAPKDRPVDGHRVRQDLVGIAMKLGIAIPPEPEDDPASSRAPRRTLPSVSLDRWASRVTIFEQMLDRAFARTPHPPDLARMLVELRELVAKGLESKRVTMKEQRVLEEVQTRGRDGRQRFGFAVDALGVDASQAKDDVRTTEAAAEETTARSEAARARFMDAHREITIWEGRSGYQQPYRDLANAYRAAADVVDAWMKDKSDERRALADVHERERTAQDLDFQIRELRTALANHEKAMDAETAQAEQKVMALNAAGDEIEKKLIALASRFCEPLRRRPELGPLFRTLDGDVPS